VIGFWRIVQKGKPHFWINTVGDLNIKLQRINMILVLGEVP